MGLSRCGRQVRRQLCLREQVGAFGGWGSGCHRLSLEVGGGARGGERQGDPVQSWGWEGGCLVLADPMAPSPGKGLRYVPDWSLTPVVVEPGEEVGTPGAAFGSPAPARGGLHNGWCGAGRAREGLQVEGPPGDPWAVKLCRPSWAVALPTLNLSLFVWGRGSC